MGGLQATIEQLGPELKAMPSHRDAEANGEGAEAMGGRCVDRAGAYEEVGTAACLLALGITPVHIQDDQGRERGFLFHAYNVRSMVRPAANERQGWYWEGKPRSMDGGDDCCAPDPMCKQAVTRAPTDTRTRPHTHTHVRACTTAARHPPPPLLLTCTASWW